MSNISIFNRLPSKGEQHRADGVITLTDFLNAVKYGKWREQVERVRQEPDKAKRDALKRNLPAVTISGTFAVRLESELISHSGYLAVDIDNFTDKAALLSDPHTFALFTSVSGRGLVVIARVNPEKHKESYRWLSHYYFSTYGIAVDAAPKNPASLRYVTFDPDIFINERAKKAGTKAEPRTAPASLPIVLPATVAGEMAAEVANLGVDIAPDYESYLRLGLSIAAGFGEGGRGIFHTVCRVSPKYDSAQADRKFTECLKTSERGSKVTVGTFYWMLKQAGVHPPREGQKAVQVAALGKRSGRTVGAVTEQLVEMEGLEREQAEALASEVFQRADIDLRKTTADPENLIEGVMEWLKQNHPIRKNTLTGKLEENGSEVTKERLNSIYLRARSIFNTKDVTFDLIERVLFSDFTPEFHPILEYIDRNRYRNGRGLIEALADTISTETPGKHTFVRKWVIGWIAAIHGHPVRSVLTLCGGQNTGKTEWFRRLPPGALRKYYAESKLDAGKDDELLMCQKLWVMDDEMGGKSKQDEKRFKELTSRSTFSLRAAYGRHNEDYKRLAVLCGTTNETDILNDPTGNTRVLPLNVIAINHEAYNSIDKDELFMEAVRAFESGESWELTRGEMAMLDEVGKDFETTPFERELILKFYAPVGTRGGLTRWETTTDIKETIEAHTKQRILSFKKFGIELKKLFGESKPIKLNGQVARRYHVLPLIDVTPQPIEPQEDTPF